MENKSRELIKIKVKNILKVEFVDHRKVKRYQQRISTHDGWCLITDSNNKNYALKMKGAYIERDIKTICSNKEYLIHVCSGNNIRMVLRPELELIKSVIPSGVEYDDRDVIEIYRNQMNLSDPYRVSVDFGNRMLKLGILESQREEDVVYIMNDILDSHLTNRRHSENISVYKGECRDKIIDLCKVEIGNKIHKHIDIEKAFDIFARKLCVKTEEGKYFLYKYTY